MKILHTADWHIGDFKGPVIDGVNLRKQDTFNCIKELVEYAKTENPDVTMISGDVFHVSRVWGNRALGEVDEVFNFIDELSNVSGMVVVMRGTPNHDGAEHFEVLEHYFNENPKVKIVTLPTIIQLQDMDIACIPGFDKGFYRAQCPGLSKEEENEAFTNELGKICIGLKASCRDNVITALMAHYTVPGCNSESGQSTFLQQFEPVLSSDTLKTAAYDIVCLGHIHRPQQLPNIENCFYSGAINANNFNDEGQDRGFYIHEVDVDKRVQSRFIKTNHRKFQTIRLNNDEIEALNAGAYDMVATEKWRGEIDGKIVRVIYNCTLDNQKALNVAVLEKELLGDGAFYVWDITPQKVETLADRQNMQKNDPEDNLRHYLEEKGYEELKISELIFKARPIIAEAMANNSSAAYTGLFEPVSIEVKNYRNYADEHFDFGDITFCTINGQNGAGKSSLFMDAIIDCLYEEPREGDLTGWIRSDEKARSGSISFVFKIGEKQFRVTRTRAKSGKGTLNLAELVEGEWQDRSAEKYKDTQTNITNLLGMDSMTFKSCALIMQDQYGLFLQAQKEDRMVILGNLLGLGVYDDMNKIAWDKARTFGAKMRDTNNEIAVHKATIETYGNPHGELEQCQTELKEKESMIMTVSKDREVKNHELIIMQEAKDRYAQIVANAQSLKTKRENTETSRKEQENIVVACMSELEQENEIRGKTAEFRGLEKRKNELVEMCALFSAKMEEVAKLTTSLSALDREIAAEKEALKLDEDKLSVYENTTGDEDALEKAKCYVATKEILDKYQEKAISYHNAKAEYKEALMGIEQVKKNYDKDLKAANENKAVLEKKVEILSESGCVDIENAHCKFLQDAIEAKKELEGISVAFDELENSKEEALKDAETLAAEKLKVMTSLDFEEAELLRLQEECRQLYPYVEKAERIKKGKSEIALIRASIDNRQSNISKLEERLVTVNLEADRAKSDMSKYQEAFSEDKEITSKLEQAQYWYEKESKLPVFKERLENSKQRIEEMFVQIKDLDIEIDKQSGNAAKELSKVAGYDTKKAEIDNLDKIIEGINAEINNLQRKIGSLSQKLGDIQKINEIIDGLNEQVVEYSKETADYDILKAAFSQDGIPHQIIRAVVPALTDSANSILGSMTGGKMGVDFRTERVLKSNSKKEVTTLDILITEYGKSTLPYLSKSGGEKVKASLSVILALAEIKSSSAGIQLGMLFIDEPPFLDSDGVSAYCDALETIQNRYQGLKVMAITHDPNMKARFPQSLDVIKTENGSKVIY